MKQSNNLFSRRMSLLLALAFIFVVSTTGCSKTVTAKSDEIIVSAPENGQPYNSETAPLPELIKEQTASKGNNELLTNKPETASESAHTLSQFDGIPEGSTFEVHYIDVGQADAELVLCDGQAMLIDGGNAADSNLIYAYLKKLSIDHLDYIVCTHSHEDHVGGLSGALNYASVDVALSPVTNYDSKAFSNFVTYLAKQDISITVPSEGDTFTLGSASVSILGPVNDASNPNNTSIVLRIVYGETSFLFTGDAEREEEQDIIEKGYELDSTVLKVGHHGSDTSTSYVFLREIMPEYAVISVGDDNSYGHPTEAVLSRLRDADVKVYRTDMQGDIVCTSDGTSVSFNVSRNTDADTLASIGFNSTQDSSSPNSPSTPSNGKSEEISNNSIDYVLNTNSHKFHYPNCSSVNQMADHNKQTFTGTRDDAIAMGYSPCGRCHP